MECSPKPQICIDNQIRAESLWCGRLLGIKRGRAQKAFWNDMRDGAEYNRNEWRGILRSMARFECRVDIKAKPGADYVCVSPEGGQKGRARTPIKKSTPKHTSIQTPPEKTPSLSPSHRKHEHGRHLRTSGIGVAKSTSATKKPSRLRHEVRQEN
jgi:hypothetical protein